MAITGAWKTRATQSEGYSGAMRWGTGINAVHAVRDPFHKPGQSREPLGSTATSDPAPEEILGPSQWGYAAEDSLAYMGEDYRYLREDHPNLGESTPGRPDRSGVVQRAGADPQPEGWPSWGPHFDDNPIDGFPVAGPTGGADLRGYSDGLDAERRHAIAVPTPGVSGGWINKARGEQLESVTSDPGQYERTTSMQQLHAVRANASAVRRQTDDDRSPIGSRTAGMKEKHFAKSLGMGGGPGAPDMTPYGQDMIYRPFTYRSAGVPPKEQHFMNTMEYRQPIQRVVPPDPYQGDYAGQMQGNEPSAFVQGPDFGYSAGDYYGASDG